MPIYEYTCRSCGKDSELFVRSDTEIKCDHCGSVEINKKFSVFAFSNAASYDMPECSSRCGDGFQHGTCGSGMCGAM